MNTFAVIHILAGSTCGLLLRLFLKYYFITKKEYFINNSLIVNALSSLFLGIFVAFGVTNQNSSLFFSVGFLGCFSTFSSFIYQLFTLIQKRKYLSLLIYYIEVLVLSFLLFFLGYFITFFFKN